MHAFACPVCRNLVFFENSTCLSCGADLGYDRGSQRFLPLDQQAGNGGQPRACANRLAGCNWLTDDELCDCCELTRTRPHEQDPDAMSAWALTEAAKRRLVFQLDSLGLPVTSRTVDPESGLAFDLLSSAKEPVTTGHDDGVITLDLAEGDDPHREALRVSLAEPYRTLLGHLRHEIGHYYWQVLIQNTANLLPCRDLFGDDRADYAEALSTHYDQPDDHSWTEDHVSRYAAAHPWEDWAESFAHYLHIRDTTQTAASWDVHVGGPDIPLTTASATATHADPTDEIDTFDELLKTWIPLSLTLNAMNRSMGKDDLYPFLLPPRVLDKLRFVHHCVTGPSSVSSVGSRPS